MSDTSESHVSVLTNPDSIFQSPVKAVAIDFDATSEPASATPSPSTPTGPSESKLSAVNNI